MIKEEEMFGLKKDGNSCPNGVIYFAAFAIPVIVLLTAMWLWGIFPMGDMSVVVMDLEVQYIDLFAWFRNVLHNGEGIFYSFSKSLGGNMFGLFSLYLTSPLNLLIYFLM